MRLKRIIAVFLVFLLVIPTFAVADTTNEESSEDSTQTEGSYSEKNEIVYATLRANGEQKDMYVVNNFTIDEPGKMVDYGPYASVENLTNLQEITLNEDQVTFTATEDQFYYQGDIDGQPLPWDIAVSYKLDGETVNPEELVGQDGKFEMKIDITANEEVDSVFFENYMLQLSLPLDSEIFQHIEAKDGMVANAGKNKQVTYTVMPESEESFVIKADVTDLEMESMEITALPSSMSIDAPDADEMTDDMKSLSDATTDINDGVGELNDGISELSDGIADLHEGSESYQEGTKEIDKGSTDLIEGSEAIDQSLEEMSKALETNSSEMGLGQFEDLVEGLNQIAEGMKETEDSLAGFKEQYSEAYAALDESIENIPTDVAPEDLAEFQNSENEAIGQLLETYQAASTTKVIYSEVKEAFQAVNPTLAGVIESLKTMRTNLETMASGLEESLDEMDMDDSITQLQEGLSALSSNYKDFHSGLVEYTDGVGELSASYGEIHDGFTEVKNGTTEMEDGVSELHDGTEELADSTNDLPDQMQDEIDEMINEYDKSDFDAVSFVSAENEKVDNVQFVIKTENIKQEEDDEEEKQEEEEKGIWERFLDLFR
ncbi:coiled-coil domain-containing protein [Oceanobacillus halotolerans]|uniref:YhgE/Pip domain-containing protein n=1 Tax=Oceanobacillus halotolerans TaxID=2663380 RepID=UPI0013DC8903|nr:YhgE/Pip domain-containing protein [Oceanobacillus halotolerans]